MNRTVLASFKILCLLFMTLLIGLCLNIQPVKASGTIHVRADGSIDPPTAPIYTADNITYTLTGNITADVDGIVIETDNIVVDGAGYTVTGSGIGSGYGITLTSRSNVTVVNMTIKNFGIGIYLDSSSYNTLSGNNVANNYYGIWLYYSSDNTVSGNNVTANNGNGIYLYSSSDNIFYHNNFVANAQQVNSAPSANVWDDGYPSGGNYWSDYNGIDLYGGPFQNFPGSDGIGDTPYVIYTDNPDRYPLMSPWTPPEHDVAIINVSPPKIVVGLGYSVNVSVTAINRGEHAEAFNVTGYANTTIIASESITLTSENFTTLTFTWNTTGFAMGNYTINAYAWPVPGETDTADNNCTWSVPVHVGLPGDVSSTVPGVHDGLVNMTDVAYTVALFNTRESSPNWVPNADVNNDGVISMKDIATAVVYFNKYE